MVLLVALGLPIRISEVPRMTGWLWPLIYGFAGSLMLTVMHVGFRHFGMTHGMLIVAIVFGAGHETLFGYGFAQAPSFIRYWFITMGMLAVAPLIANAWLFHEPIDRHVIAAVGLICAGCYILAMEGGAHAC